MIRDKYNIIPVIMALLLHGLFAGSLFVAFKWTPSVKAAMPLAIEATLVSAEELQSAPPPAVPEPEPEPLPEPDDNEQQRIEAEEQMRQEELAREQARIREQEEAERKRKAREAEERRKRDEAELERKRAEAERKRQEEVERQRRENERKRQAALAAEAEALRLSEIEAEERRLAAMNSGAMARYQHAIQQRIQSRWNRPASAQPGIECVIDVTQSPLGDVLSVTVGRCNGDAAVIRSIEAAVRQASPLPQPEDRNLFTRDLRIRFKPEQ